MNRQTEIMAGSFLLIGLGLFLLTIFTLGKERQIFADQMEYHASFRNIKGLSEGAPVRLGGITVGRVSEIRFSKDLTDPDVHVTILVNEEYLDRLREDSKVSLETQGLLGDRFVSISTSGGKAKQLEPGASLESEERGDISEVLVKAEEVVENTSRISSDLRLVLDKFRQETQDELTKVVKSTSALLKQVEEGDGFLHKLIYSKQDGDKIMKSLTSTSQNLSDITNQVKTGDGLLHALLYDTEGAKTVESMTDAAKNLAELSKRVSTIAQEITEGKGLLHEIIYDESPEGIQEIVTKLSNTAENLKTASAALADGSGTIGALLVDSSLYDNLVEVTDGAKRSFILRSAIRSSLKQ